MADLVKTVILQVVGDGGDANRMLDDLAAKAELLKAEHPELSVEIDKAKALADMAVLKAEMAATVSRDPIDVPVKPDMPSLAWTDFKTKLRDDLVNFFSGNGGGGIGGAIFGSGAISTGGGGFFSSIASLASSFGALGWGALLGSVMGLVNLAGGLITGLAAAGQGVLAFGALAYPEFSTISGAVTQLNTDVATYQSATTAAAKKTDLAKITADWQSLSSTQEPVVANVRNLESEYQNLSGALAPVVDQILTIATAKGGPIDQILQDLPAFANAVAPVIKTLLTDFNNFLGSKGAQKFQDMMIKLAPGVLLAIGTGIGKVAGAIGNLLEVFGHGNSAANSITAIFDAIAWLINALAWFISQWNQAWDSAWRSIQKFRTEAFDVLVRVSTDISNWINDVGAFLSKFGGYFENLPSEISQALHILPSELFSIGMNAASSFLAGLKSVPVLGTIIGWGNSIVSYGKKALGISSPSTEFIKIGQASAQGFRIGLTQQATGFGINVSNTTGAAGSSRLLGLQVTGGGGVLEQAIVQIIRQYVHAVGGGGPNSVQHAFGRA